MQPAAEEVVQNLTLPDSTATAAALRGAMMSFPSWRPWARASPKSSGYVVGPTTGKMGLAGGFFGGVWALAEPPAAARPSPSRRRSTPRAVVRWRLIKLRRAA